MKRSSEAEGVMSFREGLARAAAMARPRALQLSVFFFVSELVSYMPLAQPRTLALGFYVPQRCARTTQSVASVIISLLLPLLYIGAARSRCHHLRCRLQ